MKGVALATRDATVFGVGEPEAAERRAGARNAGGGSEFEQLFQLHWPRVHAVLRRLTADRDEADDLAIDVFVELHRNPPRGGADANVAGWLYRVAMRSGLNALRSRKRRQRYEGAAARETAWHADEATAGADAASAVEEMERSEERERVRAVLAALPERSASILTLRYSGCSYREIADTLRVAPSSVGTLLARAEREFERRYRATGDRS